MAQSPSSLFSDATKRRIQDADALLALSRRGQQPLMHQEGHRREAAVVVAPLHSPQTPRSYDEDYVEATANVPVVFHASTSPDSGVRHVDPQAKGKAQSQTDTKQPPSIKERAAHVENMLKHIQAATEIRPAKGQRPLNGVGEGRKPLDIDQPNEDQIAVLARTAVNAFLGNQETLESALHTMYMCTGTGAGGEETEEDRAVMDVFSP